jgi:hypothetical protein
MTIIIRNQGDVVIEKTFSDKLEALNFLAIFENASYEIEVIDASN